MYVHAPPLHLQRTERWWTCGPGVLLGAAVVHNMHDVCVRERESEKRDGGLCCEMRALTDKVTPKA